MLVRIIGIPERTCSHFLNFEEEEKMMIEQQGLNPLQRLKDTLEVAQKNTEKILTKLQRFESHLTDLDHQLRLKHLTSKLFYSSMSF